MGRLTGASVDPMGFAEALVGLPVATVMVFIVLVIGFALHKRYVVLGREFDTQEQAHLATIRALQTSHEREIATQSEARDTMQEERDWWRDIAIRALDLGERAVATSRNQPEGR